MKNKYLVPTSFILLLISAFNTFSQTKSCGSETLWESRKKKDPTKNLNLDGFKSSLRTSSTAQTVTIPVVVHVLYNTAAQNISDQQIASQIDALNRDYRKLNSDVSNAPAAFSGLAADCEISFCLAQQDPYGLPSSGITRTQVSKTSFSIDLQDAKSTATGGIDNWAPAHYLNIWVVPGIASNAGTVLGYSSFPDETPADDGVVIGYKYFGTIGTLSTANNLGRTGTHEIGHWLGLYHTFQDGCAGTSTSTCSTRGDLVCDTPPEANAAYGCPSTQNTCNETPDQNDMTMDYMDYADDKCMYLFTSGQKDRMWYHLNTYRTGIFTSKGCVTPIQINDDAALSKITNTQTDLCDPLFTPSVEIVNVGLNTANALQLEYGTTGNVQTYNWTGTVSSGARVTTVLPSITLNNGSNDFYVKIVTVNGNTDVDTARNELDLHVMVRTAQNLPFTENFDNAASFAQNWTNVNYNSKEEWQRSPLASVSGSYSLFMDNYNGGDNGEIDDIVGPLFYIQQNATLDFTYAYQLQTELGTSVRDFSDTLRIFLDVNCTGSPTMVFEGYGKDFTTVTPYFSGDQFIPAADQWRNVSVDLSAFEGKKGKLILRNICDIENSLFIDDLVLSDIAFPLAVDDLTLGTETVKVFPTMSTGTINIQGAGTYDLMIYNSTGALIATQLQSTRETLDITQYRDHFLILKIKTDTATKTFKILQQEP